MDSDDSPQQRDAIRSKLHVVPGRDERCKPSRWLAGLLAFASFVCSFATLALMISIGAALPGYAQGDTWAGFRVSELWALHASVSAILGFAFAVLVYRIVRKHFSWNFIFNACFLIGLTLLSYCLWAVLTLLPILDTSNRIQIWTLCILFPFSKLRSLAQ